MTSAAPFRAILLNGVTTGTSQPYDCKDFPYLVVYYTSTGTTSGGSVTIEEADFSDQPSSDQPYTGTWSAIDAARAASSFSGGAQLAIHLQVAAYAYVRVRIDSNITGGGSISATLRGVPS